MAIKRKIKQNGNYCLTLEQAFKEFAAEKEALNRSQATIQNYVQSYNMFVMFNNFTRHTVTEEINTTHIFQFINAMKRAGIRPACLFHHQ